MTQNNKCLNCEREETIIPLVAVRYAGSNAWICSQCLPTLIHKQEVLKSKLTKLINKKD